MSSITREHVVVIDFGAQYSQLIARRIRECHVYCEICPHDLSRDEMAKRAPIGIVLSGGPASVYDNDAPKMDPRIFELGIPILGICYGMQLMAYSLGGQVQPLKKREYGRTEIQILETDDLLWGLHQKLIVWMSHGDSVVKVPSGFMPIAQSSNTPVVAMADNKRRLYGVQFHPEVVHTQQGKKVLRNFLYRVCKCSGDWTTESFVKKATETVREQVGNGSVVCGLSGGVDSACTAALIHHAIGNQLICIFVNNGLLRKGEPQMIRKTFADTFGMRLVHVDAEERFLEKLKGITDPEKKRNIIGSEFVRVFEEEARKLGNVQFLAQGTIYPDVIESGTNYASKIKSHHNVGGLPVDMKLKLIEPLRQLFKDEVREVSRELGLPDEITSRQPFPGPGLGVRVIGEVTKERLDILREADAILAEEIRKANLYKELWQAFTILLPVQSVGIMGDRRTYSWPVVIRTVTSSDAMTADWAKLPHDLLERIGTRIVNEVNGINRVLYDITSKPPATIEWE